MLETLKRIELETTTMILTSSHGNLEDSSGRNYTLNPVPTIIYSRNQHEVAARIKDLIDITPAILSLLA